MTSLSLLNLRRFLSSFRQCTKMHAIKRPVWFSWGIQCLCWRQGETFLLRHFLIETDNKANLMCAYPLLDGRLKRTSMGLFKPLDCHDSIATQRSLSPFPDASNF